MSEKIDIQAVIQAQLNQFYSAIAEEKGNRVKVRNWQITILIASIAFLASNNNFFLNNSNNFPSYFLIGIILIFWIVEGFYQSLVLAYLKRVGELEKLLANRKKVPDIIPNELFFKNGFQSVSEKDKFLFFIRASFISKSIILFNLSLIIGVIIISLFIFK